MCAVSTPLKDMGFLEYAVLFLMCLTFSIGVCVGWCVRGALGSSGPMPRLAESSQGTPDGWDHSKTELVDRKVHDKSAETTESRDSRWTPIEVRKLTINEIRHELRLEGSDSKGIKEELVARLCDLKAKKVT